MADPIRLHILKKLTAALEEITPANGYETNLSGAVFRGRWAFGASDPLPLVAIMEPPLGDDQIEPTPDTGEQSGSWELVIQGWTNDDPKNPTDPAYVLMADVKKRLALEKRKNSKRGSYIFEVSRVRDMRIGLGTIRPPDERSEKAYFWLPLTLDVVEDLADPYALD